MLNFLKTDFKNAFNSIDRLAILTEVKAHFPSAYPLVHAMYATPSNLEVFADNSHRGSCRYKLLLFSRYKGPSTIIPGSALFPWIQLRRELTVHWYLLSDYYQTISMVKPTAYSLLLSLMPSKQSATLLLQSPTTHTHIQQ